jgi:hypothetical protein
MRKLTILILLFMTVMACHKYEDGPFISFRSVEKRVIADWKMTGYTVNGQDKLTSHLDGYDIIWRFHEDKTLQWVYRANQPIEGTWEISDDNDIIVTLKMLSGAGYYFEKDTLNLTRLTSKEMWCEEYGGIAEKYEAQ